MRRKLFNIRGGGGGGGGGASDANFNTCGGILQKCTNTHACAYTSINVHMKTHVHAPKCSYSHACVHACTHVCMHECTCRNIKTIIYLHSYMKIKARTLYDIGFRESDVSPGRTEVKQGKLVEYIFPAKGYFRETNKSQYINPISPNPKFTFGIIQIKVKSLSTSFQWLVQYKINLSV